MICSQPSCYRRWKDMRQNLKPRTRVTEAGSADATSEIDRDVARLLSAAVAEDNRLAFARSFAAAIVEACWKVHELQPNPASPPHAVELLALSSEAADTAEQLASKMARLEPRRAAYLIETIYATVLPDAYRASHVIFYTPPELVEQLLVMAENSGVNWRTARVLDASRGGRAFLLPIAGWMFAAMPGADPAFLLRQ